MINKAEKKRLTSWMYKWGTALNTCPASLFPSGQTDLSTFVLLLNFLHFSLSFSSPSHTDYYLAGAHRAPIAVQHPDLPTVLDLVVMDTVASAVMPVGAPTVVPSLQVEAHCVVGTGVPPCLAFINICREHKKR